MSESGDSLTPGQAMMLHAVIPIVLVGVALPLGLVALLLAIDGESMRGAVDRGELFLVGANAALTGCLVLLAARPDKAFVLSMISISVMIGVVLPGYVAWAYVSVKSHGNADYSVDVVVNWGLVEAAIGLATAMVCAYFAFLTGPQSKKSLSRSHSSAILEYRKYEA